MIIMGICTRRAGKFYKAGGRLYRSRFLQVNSKLVTRCCAKEERQTGSDEGEKTEKKARRAGGGGSRGTSGREGRGGEGFWGARAKPN